MTGPVIFSVGAKRVACLGLVQGTSLPQTLYDLDASIGLTLLHGDLETLALIGTQINSGIISTNNGAALLSQTGGYAPMTTTAMPHRLSRKRVNLRVAPNRTVHLARSGVNDNGRQTLVVADDTGAIYHRIEVAETYDRAAIAALDAAARDSGPSQAIAPTMPHDNIVSLSAVRCARATWDGCDTGQHLNDILADDGKTRSKTLPHIGKNKAWPVLVKTLKHFITHLHSSSISYVQNVSRNGLIQSMIAKGGTPRLLDQILMIQSDHQSFALDLMQVDSVWVTAVGPFHQLEMYAADGCAIAVFGADPKGDVRQWNALLCSLPLLARAF